VSTDTAGGCATFRDRDGCGIGRRLKTGEVPRTNASGAACFIPHPSCCGWRCLSSQDGGGEEGDDQEDREGFQECHGDVVERVVVVAREVFGLARGLFDLLLARARRLRVLHHLGGVLLGKVGHELVVDDFPRRNVKAVGEKGDQDSHGESSGERQLSAGDVVAIRADAEEDEQSGQHDGGVAENESLVAADFVQERNRGQHGHGGDQSGDHSEGQHGFLHRKFNSFVEFVLHDRIVEAQWQVCRHTFG
jgi:hypothetical protein